MNTKELKASKEKKDHADHLMSRAEATEYGRSLRNKTPRASLAVWQASSSRTDPVDILIETSKGREPSLIPIRYGRMLQSPFAFYRGAAAIMAADLAKTPPTGVYVQACGDCHLVNFGGFATPERRMIFDINDFDETLPAPWEWDVKRLAASFVIAAMHNDISTTKAKEIAIACVESYRKHMDEYAHLSPLEVWYSSISVDDVMHMIKSVEAKKYLTNQLEKAKNKSLAGEDCPKLTKPENGKVSIADNPPLIYHHKGADGEIFNQHVKEAFQRYAETLGDEKRVLFNQYKFIDVTAKVVGVGSVGRICGIALRMTADNEPLFLQVKEAVTSVLEPFAGKTVYKNSGQRVVLGQKLMQAASDIFLGWGTAMNGRHFYVRQLRDMKISPQVEVYDDKIMMIYARLCGWALARAHARSGKSAIINGYLGSSSKFADAVAEFGVTYAEQNEKDFVALKKAVKAGKLVAYMER
jgi:uncharacterized protein (DUF2252 family)